jgi:hypothetical protein
LKNGLSDVEQALRDGISADQSAALLPELKDLIDQACEKCSDAHLAHTKEALESLSSVILSTSASSDCSGSLALIQSTLSSISAEVSDVKGAMRGMAVFLTEIKQTLATMILGRHNLPSYVWIVPEDPTSVWGRMKDVFRVRE